MEATFTVEYGLQKSLLLLLCIGKAPQYLVTSLLQCSAADDEMKVEQFELTDPAGNKNIFATFDTGLVYFQLPGTSEVCQNTNNI